MFFYKKLAWKLHFYQVEKRWVFGCERWVFTIVWIINFVIGVIFFQNLRLSPQWSPIISWFFGHTRSFRDLNQGPIRQIRPYVIKAWRVKLIFHASSGNIIDNKLNFIFGTPIFRYQLFFIVIRRTGEYSLTTKSVY